MHTRVCCKQKAACAQITHLAFLETMQSLCSRDEQVKKLGDFTTSFSLHPTILVVAIGAT